MPDDQKAAAEQQLRKIITLAESPAHDVNKREQIKRLAEKTLANIEGIHSDAYALGESMGLSRASVRPGAGDMGG